MFEHWKERRQVKRQIEEMEQRLRGRVELKDASMIGYAVATDRHQIDMLRGCLKRMETERLIERAIKHEIVVPQFDEYWETDESTKKDCLTRAGEKLILNGIRDKRSEFLKRWGPIIAILISLVAL